MTWCIIKPPGKKKLIFACCLLPGFEAVRRLYEVKNTMLYNYMCGMKLVIFINKEVSK
jgi:hypothetical protein